MARRSRLRARPLALLVGALGLSVAAVGPAATEKVFVYVLYGEPDSLDSAKAESERSFHPTWLLCDTLLKISRDGQRIEPDLSESWTTSANGHQVTFRLRPGLVFHDGTRLDAQAVKASFERQFRPGHELYSAEPRNTKETMLQELIEDIEVPDSLTIVFKLKYPGLHYLSAVDIVSPTAVARLGRDFGRQPVCSGPFKFQSWTADRVVVTANDRYWMGRPLIDRVVFRVMNEPKAIVEALVKGEADFAPSLVDPVHLERLRDSGRVAVVPVPGLNIYYLGFDTDRPPFNDRRVRRAVVQGVNVPRIVVFLGRGAAVVAKGPLAPSMKAYDASVGQLPYAPEAAKELLATAGHRSGLTITLVYPQGITLWSEIATGIQHDLRRIGIDVELLGKATFAEVSRALRAREGMMFVYSWHVRAPYPERLLIPLFHSRSIGSTNFTHYTSPVVDRLLESALRFPDGPEQRQLYAQVQRQIVEDAPMLFLYHGTRMAAVGERVRGIALNLSAAPHDKLIKTDVRP